MTSPADQQTSAAPSGNMVSVPPIGHDTQVWDPPSAYGYTRRERAARGHLYKSAIPARLADLNLIIPSGLAFACCVKSVGVRVAVAGHAV